MSAALRRAVSIGLAAAPLLWVAPLNHYPLVWWDRGAEVDSAFTLALPTSRPLFYGYFLRLTDAPWWRRA